MDNFTREECYCDFIIKVDNVFSQIVCSDEQTICETFDNISFNKPDSNKINYKSEVNEDTFMEINQTYSIEYLSEYSLNLYNTYSSKLTDAVLIKGKLSIDIEEIFVLGYIMITDKSVLIYAKK